ncbi:MAG: cytochrome c assembly protein [Candidatus Angelobacter sp.]|jgi:ABC-type uncharacterized transport system permease subunit|nr:cytochrome c assembly protein [Candidatus Angelobacter sp.]
MFACALVYMPHLWMRVAVGLYGLGLLYALVALSGKREVLARIILPALGLGAIFHFVALAEAYVSSGELAPVTISQSESLLAFVLIACFFGVYWRYKTTSPGILVFPLVFLLSLSAAIGQEPPQFDSPLLRSGWILFHITLILAGYAALFFSFVSSLIYLVQEQRLKSKHFDGVLSHLPALEVMDDIGFRSLLFGFPFMTLGLIAGSVIAQASYGPTYFRDPKILLSILMWAVYMVLLFSRWSAGWRGRRAALLSTVAFIAATLAWTANYFSSVHRYVAQ